jgi:hypothetical protein
VRPDARAGDQLEESHKVTPQPLEDGSRMTIWRGMRHHKGLTLIVKVERIRRGRRLPDVEYIEARSPRGARAQANGWDLDGFRDPPAEPNLDSSRLRYPGQSAAARSKPLALPLPLDRERLYQLRQVWRRPAIQDAFREIRGEKR